ncbi:MAG: Toluene efflux pump outer membrane protein TtgI precursor [Candidatus Hydrogenedentes bacterium ADurb.Bin179]|jgi:NodT family efflux transporter outer membrane factor (OMF) lipoprotein|nr:MAG: Toluene efflux pump outer membrane protein TtgI precursor [Candidatus Hydrogenedentes bacterium ADurb.Bin179]
MRFFISIASTVFISTAIVCCAHFEPESRDKTLYFPEAFTLYDAAAPLPGRWWMSFNSEELNQTIEAALAGNLSLQQMNARLLQAEQLARKAGAVRFPELNITGETAASRRHMQSEVAASDMDIIDKRLAALGTLLNPDVQGGGESSFSSGVRTLQSRLQAAQTLVEESPPSNITAVNHSYSFGLASSYEVDLWGRVRSQYEAALLEVESSREDVYGAMLSLSGTVARQWLTVAANRQVLDLVKEQHELNEKTLNLIKLRFANGLATALDVYQQRQATAQTASLVPALEETLNAALLELAVLLGNAPRNTPDIKADALPEVGPLPAAGLPADLLANRPDIRAAGLRLQAADWLVSAARADRMPAIRLSAGASYDAEEWTAIFDNWMARLAGSLTGPLFDGGRRKAEVERTRAVVEERLAAYQLSILESVLEVELAMMREKKQAEYVELLKQEQEAINDTYEQAMQRYLNGVIDYLPVLTAMTQMQAVERRIVQAEFTRLQYRLQLCLALGGTWMDEYRLDVLEQDREPGLTGSEEKSVQPNS